MSSAHPNRTTPFIWSARDELFVQIKTFVQNVYGKLK